MGIKIVYNETVDSKITATVSKNRVSFNKDVLVNLHPYATSTPIFRVVCGYFTIEKGYFAEVFDDNKLQFKIIAE